MPIWKITDPKTNRTLRLTSQDSTPPSPEEIEGIFSAGPQATMPEPSSRVDLSENLSGKISAPQEPEGRENIISVAAGISPQEQIQSAASDLREGRNIRANLQLMSAAMQQAGMDLATIPANYFNMLLLNAPRSMVETYTPFKFPSEAENAGIDKVAKLAGIVGAIKSPAGGWAISKGSLLEKGARGAALGAAYSPETFHDIGARIGQAGFGFALPYGGRVATNAGRGLAKFVRFVGGIFPETAKQAARVGFDRVADPIKRQAGYFTKELVPKVRNGINRIINEGSDKADEFLRLNGASDKAIRRYRDVGIKKLQETADRYTEGTGTIVSNVENYLEKGLDDAGSMFDEALTKMKKPTLKFDNTVSRIRGILKGYDLIDEQGFLKTSIKEKEIPQAVKVIANMYDDLVGSSRTLKGTIPKGASPEMNKGFFTFYRQMLRNTQKTAGSFKKDVQGVIEGLYDDIEQAGAKGTRMAKDAYKKAMTNYDKYSGKVSEALLKRKSLDAKTINMLREVDGMLPKDMKFLTDLYNIRSAEEIFPIIQENLDNVNIEKNLMNYSRYMKPGYSKMTNVSDMYRLIDEKLPDDALAHYLAKDLYQETGGAGFMGMSSATRLGAEALTRFGLKHGETARKVGTQIPETIKRLRGL